MSTNYIKRPSETVRAEFDMRGFVAEVDPEVVTFVTRFEEGLAIVDVTAVAGLIELDVSGGLAGRVYEFGVEATTTSGQSRVDTRRMRLVEPALLAPADPSSYVIDGGSPSSVYGGAIDGGTP